MEWTKLAPPAIEQAGKRNFTAQVRKYQSSKRLYIHFTEEQRGKFGNPETMSVFCGGKDDDTQIRLVPGGDHPVRRVATGSYRISAQVVAGLPEVTTRSLTCDIITNTDKEVILRLPTAMWRGDPKEPVTPTGKEEKPPAAKKATMGLDVKQYLGKKGHEVKFLANSKITLDGALVSTEQLLNKVNSHRNKEGLDALAADDLTFS